MLEKINIKDVYNNIKFLKLNKENIEKDILYKIKDLNDKNTEKK